MWQCCDCKVAQASRAAVMNLKHIPGTGTIYLLCGDCYAKRSEDIGPILYWRLPDTDTDPELGRVSG